MWPNCVLLPAASRQKLPSYTHWSVFFCRKLLRPLSLGRTVLYNFHAHYDNTGCRGFKRGVQNWKDCCLKINIPKGNYWILRIGLMGSLSSLLKSEFLKFIISFLYYFWCQNWDQWHIYFFYFWFKNKLVWAVFLHEKSK